MKHKSVAARIKAGPDDGLKEGEFTAYASVFNNRDSYGDVVQPGAFSDTLKSWEETGAPIPLLFGHRMDDPDFNIGHVVEAKEDEHGLLVKAQLDLEAPKGAATYRLLKGRRINQMSYAYDVVDGEEKDGDYLLKALKVHEISVVPIGANQETEVLSVKAGTRALKASVKAGVELTDDDISALSSARDAIDAILSNAGDDSTDSEPTDDSTSQEEKASAADSDKVNASTDDPKGKVSVNTDDRKAGQASVNSVMALISIAESED